MTNISSPDVLVIGAGAAGLAATDHLQRQGVKVLCIEAAAHIGGRVHTDQTIFNMPFDQGAHWLHNQYMTPFIDIGRDLDLTMYPGPENFGSSTFRVD